MRFAMSLLMCIVAPLCVHADDAIFGPVSITTGTVSQPSAARVTGKLALAELAGGKLVCVWSASADGPAGAKLYWSQRERGAKEWSPAREIALDGQAAMAPVLHAEAGTVYLAYASAPSGDVKQAVVMGTSSGDGGVTWQPASALFEEKGLLPSGKAVILENGTILLPLTDSSGGSRIARSMDEGNSWSLSAPIKASAATANPVLLRDGADRVVCLMSTDNASRNRMWRSESLDSGATWSAPVEFEVPNQNTAFDAVHLSSGRSAIALNPAPGDQGERLSIWLAPSGVERWTVYRDVARSAERNLNPAMLTGLDGQIHLVYAQSNGTIKHAEFNEAWVWEDSVVRKPYHLGNLLPPLLDEDDPRSLKPAVQGPAIQAGPFEEHLRGRMTESEANDALKYFGDVTVAGLTFEPAVAPSDVTSRVERSGTIYVGTTKGLYIGEGAKLARHKTYGINGPLSTQINALAMDSKGTLWIGTPLGITTLKADGSWSHIRGKQGLPVEDVTAIAIDEKDRLWIGTSVGAVHYRPYEEGRQWFYRAGKRYLLGNAISAVAIAPGGAPVYFKTDAGLSRLDTITHTLHEKADKIEARLNQFHRRLGLVAACTLDDAENPTSSIIIDDDNDGLWTSYHVVAMSLAYAATGNEAYRESAKKGMDAIVMLQNASGKPGLVARSVLPKEEGLKKREEMKDRERRDMREQWQPTPDGEMYWKSDTSSDEIDGHYFALYAYWRHIAQFLPEERARIEKQARSLTDYIVANGYQLVDWDGETTTWGHWDPPTINGDPTRYGDNGLNSLQMMSFLKTTHLITGDRKYKDYYDTLVCDHGYLNNVLLEKKVFPDSNNHSDNQLGYVAWYPILQTEWDPKVREALHRSVRRHYKIIEPERSSFFNFVTATIDPAYVDIEGAVQNLREISVDRRQWTMVNSHRADVIFQERLNRHGDPILTRVLPADERTWNRWNTDPFVPDAGGRINQHVAGSPLSPHNTRTFGPSLEGEGRTEDDGGSFLLSYWLARYHGFVEG